MGVCELSVGLRSQFQSLQWQLEEHLPVGSPVELFIGLSRDLSGEEFLAVTGALTFLVVFTALPQIGETKEWRNALRLKFRRPRRDQGVQLARILEGSFLGIGMDDILGWRIGGV